MSRRRLTQRRWRELLAQQPGSGLSVSGFCARHGVGQSTFFSWRRRLVVTPAFVELTTKAGDKSVTSAPIEPIELLLPLGVKVRVRRGFDAVTLRQVVETLS